MSESIKNEFDQNGFVVLEDFFWPEECDEIKQAAQEIAIEHSKNEEKAIFSTQNANQHKEEYFINSNDKIRCFYEDGAFGEDGQLKVEPTKAFNKIGHALHLLHPLFRCYTYCDRVKTVCRELELKEPAVVQSMYIFKNPGIGGEVIPHQDSTYLYTEPVPPIGFWIALEDATIQNGCLWMARGSHKSGVHRRLIRNPDQDAKDFLIYDKPAPVYPESSYTAVPVKKGTCVLIHGNVVHKSAQNRSNISRHAYTFHVVETHENQYSADNWLQEGPEAPFQNVYNTMQIQY